MTTETAIKKLKAEAAWQRTQGRYEVAHEYQRDASDLARLAQIAAKLPRRPKPKTKAN